MSDKVSNLGQIVSLDTDDLFYVVDNASGTYTSYKMPVSDLLTFLESYHYTEAEVDSLLSAKADVIQCKYDGTTAPIATDDTNSGYEVGSLWVDVTNDEAYRCVDATASAAVWVNTSLEIGDLGSIATQNANSVTITGGSVSGITDLAVADGGTGASDAATARSNLGINSMALFNYGSDFATSAATTIGLAATGVTSGVWGGTAGSTAIIRGMTLDAGGRISAVVASTFTPGTGDLVSTNNLSDVSNAGTSRTNLGLDDPSNYPTDLRDVQEDFIIPDTCFSGRSGGDDLIENGLSYDQIWDLAPATIVAADGSVLAADTGATAPSVYLAISGTNAFTGNLSLTETEAAATISSGASSMSTGQRYTLSVGTAGSNADATDAHIRLKWRIT